MAESYIDFMKEIALEAGKIHLKGFRSDNTVIWYKSRTDLLTNVDKESEAFLFETIKKKFPDHSIIAEEGSRKDVPGDIIWYIDPLDGTNNFAHGLPFFCVSIGVYSRRLDAVISGIVYNAFVDEMFTAEHGKGAFLNEKKIMVSEISDIGISILATGFPYDKSDINKINLHEFGAFLPKIQGVRRFGSAAIDLSYVACGRLDGYWEGQLKPWDIAAGMLIVKEAGGSVSRYDGSGTNPEHPYIVASNEKIHKQMLDILATAAK